MHRSVVLSGIDFIDPDNASDLFAMKAHLCVVLLSEQFEFASLESDTGGLS